MWAWLSTFAALSFQVSLTEPDAIRLSSLVSFLAIALGGLACVFAGVFADRIGKSQVTIYAMGVSGVSALATALSFGGPVWITVFFILIWGISIIPDSAQFSALVADHTPADKSGSILTLQTALGFGLTIITVQGTPYLVAAIGWPATLGLMALGPLFGIYFMRQYLKLKLSNVK
jgi:MFS family permease